VLVATPSVADITFCNVAGEDVDLAFGYLDHKRGWTAAGWFAIRNGNCSKVWTGWLGNNYYYTRVVSSTGRFTWDAPASQSGGFFCISTNKFTLHTRRFQRGNVIDCERHGYETAKFTQFNTNGSNNVRHTIRVPSGGSPSETPAGGSPPPPGSQPGTSVPSTTTPGGSACQRFPNLC
jgi:uncharacterized membrane protein